MALLWLPTTQQVATLIPTRTLLSDGTYAGDFTPATVPQGVQVTSLINLVGAEVAGEVGVVPLGQYEQATYVASIGAASLVELSYFPEQVRSKQSAYPDLDARYVEALARLVYSVAEGGQGESLVAQFSFPNTDILTPLPPPGIDPNAAPQTDFLTEY